MMTKEDIIRMAHEAGLHLATDVNWMPIIDIAYAEKFAELVASAEREACAQVCESMRPSKEEFDQRYYAGCTDSAAAIRARKEK